MVALPAQAAMAKPHPFHFRTAVVVHSPTGTGTSMGGTPRMI
jgi:hypothetical protein